MRKKFTILQMFTFKDFLSTESVFLENICVSNIVYALPQKAIQT